MKPKSTINHLILIAVPILLCGVLGCDTDDVSVGDSYVPRVRLVKDGPNEFHFQWDEQLKEERIILCNADITIAITTDSPAIEGYKASGFPFPRLIYFPEGAFISEPVKDYFTFIEILPASERYKYSLPSYAYGQPGNNVFERRRILREHPFKPYHVGKPSRLTLEVPEINN